MNYYYRFTVEYTTDFDNGKPQTMSGFVQAENYAQAVEQIENAFLEDLIGIKEIWKTEFSGILFDNDIDEIKQAKKGLL